MKIEQALTRSQWEPIIKVTPEKKQIEILGPASQPANQQASWYLGKTYEEVDRQRRQFKSVAQD